MVSTRFLAVLAISTLALISSPSLVSCEDFTWNKFVQMFRPALVKEAEAFFASSKPGDRVIRNGGTLVRTASGAQFTCTANGNSISISRDQPDFFQAGVLCPDFRNSLMAEFMKPVNGKPQTAEAEIDDAVDLDSLESPLQRFRNRQNSHGRSVSVSVNIN